MYVARLIASYLRHIPPAPLNVGIPEKMKLSVRVLAQRERECEPTGSSGEPSTSDRDDMF